MNTVSNESFYCAHCGHIEPTNLNDVIEGNANSFVYAHKESCGAINDSIAHDMFVALANSMTHMRMNDALTSRIEDHITNSMAAFADFYLTTDSHVYTWIDADMRLK